MSTNKKYFYMRLKEDFFRSPELIAVESMPNGYQYSNILLKLYLLSLRGNGRIMAGAIPYSPEMIARATGHDCETVNEAIALFSDVGLIEKLGLFICLTFRTLSGNQAPKPTDSETTNGELKRSGNIR